MRTRVRPEGYVSDSRPSRPAHRYSGCKKGWIPYDGDEVATLRDQWRAAMRNHVLNTAADLLAEVGPRRFTVVELAYRAGVGRTSIYKYLGLKAELLSACREHTADWCGRRLERVAATHGRDPEPGAAGLRNRLGPALARVWRVVAGMIGDLRTEGDLWLLATAEGVRSKRRPAPCRAWELPSPLPARLNRVLRQALDRAGEAGEIGAGVDLQTLARWLGALWWYHLCVEGPSHDHPGGGDGAPAENSTAGLDTALSWLLLGAGAA